MTELLAAQRFGHNVPPVPQRQNFNVTPAPHKDKRSQKYDQCQSRLHEIHRASPPAQKQDHRQVHAHDDARYGQAK